MTHVSRASKPAQVQIAQGTHHESYRQEMGQHAAVRIPDSVMAAAHDTLDQPVNVREVQRRIVIEPVRRKEYKLDELLGGITAKNQHKPVDTGAPVGKEIW